MALQYCSTLPANSLHEHCYLLKKNKSAQYRRGTHVRTNGTDVFAANMLSSISQAGGDKSMKPMAFYRVFILVLWKFLPDF